MGRTMIAALLMVGMLSGCTDWREGPETVEACLKRHALKEGAVDPLADDQNQWVPSYTYDVTKLAPAAMRSLVMASPTKGQTEGIAVLEGSSTQKARDDFFDTPATEAGLALLADDPSLYKIRGKRGLYRDLLRQGCEGQDAGMRLISWQAAREDALIDGELPKLPMSAAQMREFKNKFDKPSIKDILP